MGIRQKHRKANNARFHRWSRLYDTACLPIANIRNDVANSVASPRGAKILDVACGTGSQSVAFARRGHSVTGIDISPDMLTVARRKLRPGLKLKFIMDDATNLSFSSSYFDVSCVSFGLHDMPEQIALQVLREMKRVTKSKGYIFIIDYDNLSSRLLPAIGNRLAKIGESQHYDHFIRVGLKHYIKRVGLKRVAKKSYFFGYFQFVRCRNSR